MPRFFSQWAFRFLLSRSCWDAAASACQNGSDSFSELSRLKSLPDFGAFVGHTGLQWARFPDWARRLAAGTGGWQSRPIVIFIHDLIPITHPEYCRRGQAAVHEARIRHSIAAADLLVVNSEDTRRELEKFSSLERLCLPTVVVAPLAPCLPPVPSDNLSAVCLVEGPYFVVVGTVEARKNHALLLNVWDRLVSQHREQMANSTMLTSSLCIPKLLVIGQPGWEADSVISRLEGSRWCPVDGASRVPIIWFPDASDREVASLLRGAVALLMPSFAEGYGLPVAEALTLRVPVIASDIPAHREVGGGAALYLSPEDGDGWHEAVLSYMDSDFRKAAIERISQWTEPKWFEHFQAVERGIFAVSQNSGRLIVVGFRVWRQGVFLPLLNGLFSEKTVVFASGLSALRKLFPRDGDIVLCWNQPVWAAEIGDISRRLGAEFVQMEDGFLRSVGLGSDLVPPQSVVVDSSGIYFDPRRPSDLEKILLSANFDELELDRARRLISAVRDHGLSKYNFPEDPAFLVPSWKAQAQGRRVLLVPGQVAEDSSVVLGCTLVDSIPKLLGIVRRENPDAFIVFRPHPDVLVGNRRGIGANAVVVTELYDVSDSTTSVAVLLQNVDEVHTLTSLVGFEGLLRGKPVFTYGVPFYAGWGLTIDRAGENGDPAQEWLARRRLREDKLTLEELAAGVLLRYSMYFNWSKNTVSSAEDVVSVLVRERARFRNGGALSRYARKTTAIVRGAWGSLCYRSGFRKFV